MHSLVAEDFVAVVRIYYFDGVPNDLLMKVISFSLWNYSNDHVDSCILDRVLLFVLLV